MVERLVCLRGLLFGLGLFGELRLVRSFAWVPLDFGCLLCVIAIVLGALWQLFWIVVWVSVWVCCAVVASSCWVFWVFLSVGCFFLVFDGCG